jgi:hypothetical protein
MTDYVKALITAVVVAGLIPVVLLIVSALVGGIGSTASTIVFVVSMVVVALLLVRSFLLYRQHKAGRSA